MLKPRINTIFWNRITFIALIGVIVNPAHSVSPRSKGIEAISRPAGQIAEFEPSACQFELPAGVQEGEDVECGFVVVPQVHAVPEGGTIRLAIAIIKSKDPNHRPDPLFMAQGGPGGSSIETYANRLLTKNEFVTDRDIVLFDQRGTLYSEPDLYCDEMDELIAETIEKNLTDDEDRRLTLAALHDCRTRLSSGNIDLSAYDSLENAADVEDIRVALGYEEFNFYGVSYGTLLGLHLLDSFPQNLRSIVLDGVVPRQTNFNLNSAQTMNASFDNFFHACQVDPDCDAEYPDLERVFFDLVHEFNQEPVLISLTDTDKGITYAKAVIDGDAFMNALFQMLYAGSIIPALPRMIYDAVDGKFDFFSRIYALLIFDRTMSIGMYYSVVCSEDADFTPSDQDLNGVRPEIVEYAQEDPEYLLQTCLEWDVEPLGDSADQPVSSEIPTLLLSGGFDPITPPVYAEEAAKTLTHSYQVVFPAGGHGQALEGECENSIIKAFIDNPTQSPDTSCLEGKKSPEFYTKANTIDFPPALELLNLERKAALEFLTLSLGLLFLLSAVIGIPVIWLIAFLRRRRLPKAPSVLAPVGSVVTDRDLVEMSSPGVSALADAAKAEKSSFLSKIAGWLAFLAGPVLAVFIIGLAVVLFEMVFANDNRLFFGVRASAGWLFILSWLFALLSLGMLLACLASWIKRYWSVWTRIYYTLLTISGMVCLAVLVIWGVLTAMLPALI